MKALITGASSGIGREIAIYLSEKGWETVLVARRGDRLEQLSQCLKTASYIECCDITEMGACQSLFEKHPDIDMLVNSAGCGVFGEFSKTSLEREEKMIELNITALHILTKLYLKAFLNKNKGIILNIASSAGFFSGPFFSSYYASKAYVLHLTDAISYEVRKTGVSVSVFCPGPVKTEFGSADGIKDGKGAISPRCAAVSAVEGALRGKRIIFPDAKTRALVFFSRFMPRKILMKIVAKQQLKKTGSTCQTDQSVV